MVEDILSAPIPPNITPEMEIQVKNKLQAMSQPFRDAYNNYSNLLNTQLANLAEQKRKDSCKKLAREQS